MKIEEIKEKEYAQVSKLLVEFWKDFRLDYDLKYARSLLLRGYKSEIVDDKFFVIRDRKVIGVLSLVVYKDGLAEIMDFVVKKMERRKGCGSELMKFVIEYAKKKKVRKLFSLVFPEAKGFYEKYKFKEEGLLKDHFKEGQDMILMSLKMKKEKQVGLKDELEQIEVREKTEEKLLHLPIR